MYKKTITYKDFNGTERTEDFYFHLKQSTLARMELLEEKGLVEYLEDIVKAMDRKKLIATFDDIIRKSYGVKSDDGRRFIQNDQVYEEFTETEAYSKFFMELITDDEEAARFINGIMPELPQDHNGSEKNVNGENSSL